MAVGSSVAVCTDDVEFVSSINSLCVENICAVWRKHIGSFVSEFRLLFLWQQWKWYLQNKNAISALYTSTQFEFTTIFSTEFYHILLLVHWCTDTWYTRTIIYNLSFTNVLQCIWQSNNHKNNINTHLTESVACDWLSCSELMNKVDEKRSTVASAAATHTNASANNVNMSSNNVFAAAWPSEVCLIHSLVVRHMSTK